MANDEKSKKVKEQSYDRLVDFYCGKKNHKKWYLLIIAVCFAAVAIFFLVLEEKSDFTKYAHYVAGGLTAVFVLLFILDLFGAFTKTPSHNIVAELMDEDHDVAYQRMFESLALEKDPNNFIETPIEFAAPAIYPGRGKTLFSLNKNRIVYSQSNYHWLLFGTDTLYHYSASVNHLDRVVGFEIAEEFLYTDIVTVKTEVKRVDDNGKSFEVMQLIFSLINGQTIEITMRNIEAKNDETRPLTDLEKTALATIRRVIREHK